MRQRQLVLSGLVLALFCGSARATDVLRAQLGWSHVEFEVSNFGLNTVSGHFTSYACTLALDAADVTRSSVTVSIQAASVDTRNKKRDEHLRTKDFFDVEKFPEITFRSEKIVKSEAAYVMTGLLTIKGHAKLVDLPFSFTSGKSEDGKALLHATATTTINRHDFGIDYGNHFSVGKEIHIRIQIQAVP